MVKKYREKNNYSGGRFIVKFDDIKQKAKSYEKDMSNFLRDLIAIPGESCGEEKVVKRIVQEMEKLSFDKVEVDPMGNVLGYMGSGEKLIAYDGHVDTVGIGEPSNWNFDPYEGYETDTEIGGRGASDQLGGVVSAVYGAKIMKDLGLLSDKYTVLVTVNRKKTVMAYVGNILSKKKSKTGICSYNRAY